MGKILNDNVLDTESECCKVECWKLMANINDHTFLAFHFSFIHLEMFFIKFNAEIPILKLAILMTLLFTFFERKIQNKQFYIQTQLL